MDEYRGNWALVIDFQRNLQIWDFFLNSAEHFCLEVHSTAEMNLQIRRRWNYCQKLHLLQAQERDFEGYSFVDLTRSIGCSLHWLLDHFIDLSRVQTAKNATESWNFFKNSLQNAHKLNRYLCHWLLVRKVISHSFLVSLETQIIGSWACQSRTSTSNFLWAMFGSLFCWKDFQNFE